jgi:hypothetical protein
MGTIPLNRGRWSTLSNEDDSRATTSMRQAWLASPGEGDHRGDHKHSVRSLPIRAHRLQIIPGT